MNSAPPVLEPKPSIQRRKTVVGGSLNFFFRHSKAALLTKHKKERIIGPLVERFLGMEILHTDQYDTDLFGSFTREIPRMKSQVDTLREKTKKGMELCELEIGMASEGSFATDPMIGMIPWNYEMVMIYDKTNDIEIIGQSGGPFTPLRKTVDTFQELAETAKSVDFPHNGLIIRPDDESSPIIFKESSSVEELEINFIKCLKLSRNNAVFVENDLRSHKNAERRKHIEYAVIDLIIKCHSLCPECHSPGFWVDRGKPGWLCSSCGAETDVPRYVVYKCGKCGVEREVERKDITEAGPQDCGYCNP